METFEAICKRASVRKYAKKAVSKPLLEKLVDAGRRAPSAKGIEPWEFIIVTDKEKLVKLGNFASPNGSFIKDACSCIVVSSRDTKYYLEDGVAATENILIAACDAGLGACWVAGDKKPYAAEILAFLGVSAEFKLVSLISLGWPEAKTEQNKNRRLEDVIHWEKF